MNLGERGWEMMAFAIMDKEKSFLIFKINPKTLQSD